MYEIKYFKEFKFDENCVIVFCNSNNISKFSNDIANSKSLTFKCFDQSNVTLIKNEMIASLEDNVIMLELSKSEISEITKKCSILEGDDNPCHSYIELRNNVIMIVSKDEYNI